MSMFASLDEEFGFKPPSGVGACTVSNTPDGMGNSIIQDRIKGLSWKEIADKYSLGSPSAARSKFTKLTGITDYKIKGTDLQHLVDNNLLDSLKGATEKKVKKAAKEMDEALKVAEASVQSPEAVQAVAEGATKVAFNKAKAEAKIKFVDIEEKYTASQIEAVTKAIDNGQGYLNIKNGTGLEFAEIDEIAWSHILVKHDGDVWKAYLSKPTSENGFNAVKQHVFDMQKQGFLNNEIAAARGIPDSVLEMITDGNWSMPPMGAKTPVLQKVSSPSYGYSPPPPAAPPQNTVHYTHPTQASGGFQPHPETKYIEWMNGLGKDLTATELEAVKSYTGSAYHSINSGLRGGGQVGGTAQNIDKSFRAIPFDTTVYRHVDMNAFPGDLKSIGGTVYKDAGYMSTAVVDGGFGASKSIKLIIDVPKGSKARYVAPISNFPGEKEMLLPRDSKFLITRVEQKGHQWIIRMTLMAAA